MANTTNHKFSVGDTVWYIDSWSGMINKGTIIQFQHVKTKDGSPVAAIIQCQSFGTIGKNITDLYPSEETAITALHKETETIKEKYRNEITDIKSLVQFLYTHNVHSCEEYTDWEAKTVAKEKIKELLGFDPDA